MKTISITARDPGEIKSALREATKEGFSPTLAIVFMPVGLDHAGICRVLDEEGILIFGANTPDKFSDQGMEKNLATILLLDLDPACFRIVLEEIPTNSYDAVMEKAQGIARTGLECFSQLAFIVSVSKIELPGEALVDGFLSVAGEAAPVIGGVSGGQPYWGDHVVFNNKEKSNQGAFASSSIRNA
jgi:hypothetical protein